MSDNAACPVPGSAAVVEACATCSRACTCTPQRAVRTACMCILPPINARVCTEHTPSLPHRPHIGPKRSRERPPCSTPVADLARCTHTRPMYARSRSHWSTQSIPPARPCKLHSHAQSNNKARAILARATSGCRAPSLQCVHALRSSHDGSEAGRHAAGSQCPPENQRNRTERASR